MGLITKSSPINFGGVNKMMPAIMSMLSQKHFIDLRNKNMQDLLEQRMSGYRGLETQRHESTITEIGERHEKSVEYIKEKVRTELAKDDQMQQLAGRIYLDELEGKDTTGDMNRLKQGAKAIALLAAKTANLETGTTDEFIDASMVATEDFVQSMGTQMATTGRHEERLTREVEPAHKIAEERLTLDTAREKRIRETGTGGVGAESSTELIKLYNVYKGEQKTIEDRMDYLDPESTDEEEKAEYLELMDRLEPILEEKKLILEKIRRIAMPGGAGQGGGFQEFKSLLKERKIPEEDADRIARDYFPEG